MTLELYFRGEIRRTNRRPGDQEGDLLLIF